MTKPPKNIGASVRARLLRLAQQRGDDFQLLLTRYASERLLHRLATSSHASSFVLKGAVLFSDSAEDLAGAVKAITAFVEQPLAAASIASRFPARWSPGRGWELEVHAGHDER